MKLQCNILLSLASSALVLGLFHLSPLSLSLFFNSPPYACMHALPSNSILDLILILQFYYFLPTQTIIQFNSHNAHLKLRIPQSVIYIRMSLATLFIKQTKMARQIAVLALILVALVGFVSAADAPATSPSTTPAAASPKKSDATTPSASFPKASTTTPPAATPKASTTTPPAAAPKASAAPKSSSSFGSPKPSTTTSPAPETSTDSPSTSLPPDVEPSSPPAPIGQAPTPSVMGPDAAGPAADAPAPEGPTKSGVIPLKISYASGVAAIAGFFFF